MTKIFVRSTIWGSKKFGIQIKSLFSKFKSAKNCLIWWNKLTFGGSLLLNDEHLWIYSNAWRILCQRLLLRNTHTHTRPGGKTYPIPKGIKGWAKECLYFCLKSSQPATQPVELKFLFSNIWYILSQILNIGFLTTIFWP